MRHLSISSRSAPYRRHRRRCAADAAAVGDIIDPGVRRPTDARTRHGPATIAFLEVAPSRVACSHPRLAIARCLQVRDVTFDAHGLRAGPPGEWRFLYEPIDGFEHVEGIRSVLRVKRFARPPAPAEAPATFYLVDLVVESGTPQK